MLRDKEEEKKEGKFSDKDFVDLAKILSEFDFSKVPKPKE